MKMIRSFTLAEVLIAIGVIGVVAALTIPNFVANYQKKQTVSRLKDTYTKVTQAIKLAEVEHDDISGWDFTLTGAEFFEEYLAPHLKIVKSEVVADPRNKYKEISGKYENGLRILSTDNGIKRYTLLNGTQIIVSNIDTQRSTYIDTNGSARPNQFGKDVFCFFITRLEVAHGMRLVPTGFFSTGEYTLEEEMHPSREHLKTGTSNYNYGCNKNGRGMFCAALIMLDNWEIKPDYPW